MSKNPLTLSAPAGEPFLEYQRDFDFPVRAVFQGHTDPDLYVQWIGPVDLTTRMDVFEPRSGGAYRVVQSAGDGEEYAFHGMFHTVRDNEFLLQTFEFEGYPDVVTLEYSTFSELPDGRSRVTGRSLYPSVESRDEFLGNGIEEGMSDGYDQLDDLLASVRTGS
ncbi:SRPBCC family protein [Arthrobacter sp. zg-Y179]|uniref:SRPBCC family protein n=1 Tax=Arthrobacter sp. zg-Y179 TaxID=2894188 RepID=UPI001E30F131|nr:SRPBCC family protein [Arthrobacter sp. zg-Y179]MCC9175496.1 SRPBCC family protein [Arthrobacter sp. zg-Y179]